jgi:hypothetical protein
MSVIVRPGNLAPASPSVLVESQKFVVLLNANDGDRRLFSVQFERRANGLGYYVHLPYFAHARGVLSRIVVPGPAAGPTKVDLQPAGTTTTQRVKFTHHPDGAVHFSQDGKVLTKVRTRTPPLSTYQRHLFTVNYWGLDAFETAAPKDLKGPKSDRTSVRFQVDDLSLPVSQLAGRIVAEQIGVPPGGIDIDPKVVARGPITEPIIYRRADGSRNHGIPLFPLRRQPDDFGIILTHLPNDRSSGMDAASLVLVGGWDEPHGKQGPLTGIAIHYTDHDPAEWDKLVQARGTIDLPPHLR